MLIAQISDFHVVAAGALAYGQVDTNAALAAAVAALNAVTPKPDLVIGTGDLTQGGLDDEYAVLREILSELQMPFLPMVGNHDRRDGVRRAFSDLGFDLGAGPYVQYEYDAGGLRILILDTVLEGSDEPQFDAARLEWLRARLAERRPTLVAMHHPPFPTGVGWLEPADPTWSAGLGDIVAGAPHVVRLICGHVHRGMFRTWRGVPASTAPSTAHQVALHLAPEARPELAHEAAGFHLHRWDGVDLVTYAASPAGFTNRFTPGAGA